MIKFEAPRSRSKSVPHAIPVLSGIEGAIPGYQATLSRSKSSIARQGFTAKLGQVAQLDNGVIARVVPSTHAVHITVDVGFPLVAAVTARSAAELGLAPGTRVCAVFKASAVYLIGHAAPA